MKTVLILLIISYSISNVIAQTIENPLEPNDEIMWFYDFNVLNDKIHFIYTNASAQRQFILSQTFVNDQWVKSSNDVLNGTNKLKMETSRNPFNLKHNPKIVFDKNGNLWVTGNALYRKIDSLWMQYNAPLVEKGYDTIKAQLIHELYFTKNNQPYTSALLTYLGPGFSGFRIGVFEIFKLVEDTLRHTRIDDKISSIKGSSTHLVDESKMTMVDDTIVVYKPNGMFFFVNPDFSFDSIAFPGYSGKLSRNLEIRQIQPEGELSKLWVLADKSPSTTNNKELCCSGLYLLENKKQWTVFTESNGMPQNNDGSYYSPRSLLKLPNGEHLVAMSPDTISGRFSVLYTIDASKKLTRVPLDNILVNAKVFPRSQFYRGITKETFTKIFDAIRTNTVTEPIPYTEILKIRLDGSGNLWWMMKDCIVIIPSFIPTSVNEDKSSGSSILVIPNPSTQTIALKSIPSSCDKIEIVSVHGQIVQSVTSNYQHINIQTLPSGVYLIKAYTKSGIQTTTFIKEN